MFNIGVVRLLAAEVHNVVRQNIGFKIYKLSENFTQIGGTLLYEVVT